MKTNTIAYLGPEGSFCEQAAIARKKAFGSKNTSLVACTTIPGILYAIQEGIYSFGVVPAENSIEGSVHITLDILAHELNLYIQQEIVLDIEHHLISHSQDLQQIKTVLSHPQALAQCRSFLEQFLPDAELCETSSTSEAASKVSSGVSGLAAIASWNSHIIYNVPVIAKNIGDYKNNQTRFFVVGREPFKGPTTKTSLVLGMKKDRPGSLYEALGEFAKYNINLTRIESRPAKKELGNYIFFIDCEAGESDQNLKQVMCNLSGKTILLRSLGSYGVIHG